MSAARDLKLLTFLALAGLVCAFWPTSPKKPIATPKIQLTKVTFQEPQDFIPKVSTTGLNQESSSDLSKDQFNAAIQRLQNLKAASSDPQKRTKLGLTDEELQLLDELPPICLTEKHGIEVAPTVQPFANSLQNKNSSPILSETEFQTRSDAAASKFEWPSETDARLSSPINDPHVQQTGFVETHQAIQNRFEARLLGTPSTTRIEPISANNDFDSNEITDNSWNLHATSDAAVNEQPGVDPHLKIYSRSAFPSAQECATCHKQIYEEWALSSHAYASISPMFHKFENTINKLAQGTIGYFCLRCHAPVATTMGLRRDQPIWDGPRVFREGVTCVACHRVKSPYVKADGERRIEPGDIYEPVYGSGDGHGAAVAAKYDQILKTKTRPESKTPGQAMHRRAIQFEELSKSTFCMSCHQVAVKPGIKLEVVWDQYRASPAYKEGITCQDCHMGRVPGLDEGYSIGPAAVIDGKVVNPDRKHSNHLFYGPGYSIAHPGIFPDTKEADRWTVNQWLEFDWRAGWGTDQFEDEVAHQSYPFPTTWANADDRYDAREIVDANLKKLEYKRDVRKQLLENGSKLDGPFFAEEPRINEPLQFRYCVTNLNSGHNMPSGSLGAQPQLWVNVVLIGPVGQRLWESGYLDSNGDLADNHSLDVLARRIPLDSQLMNFQTKFLTTNVKGTDREMYLPINFDFDQLPFLRPAQQPVSVMNHPPFIRMESHSLPPLGSRNAKYAVPAHLMQMPGTYRLSVRMRSRAEPIYFMRFCNATSEMERSMNEWICDIHTSTVTFEVR